MLIPSHTDADAFLFVVEGASAIVTLLRNENRESYNMRVGDVLRLPAGVTVYVLDSDSNKRLRIVKLLQTISVPGRVQPFFPVGDQDRESYYLKFSRELLESAFNAPLESIRRVFGKQQEQREHQGSIVSVRDESIREIREQASSSMGRRSPFGGTSRGPFNIFDQRPFFCNQHGRLHKVDAGDYEQLRDADIDVSHLFIRGGSMMVPHYNSRSFKIAVVVSVEGWLEIVSPHLSESSHRGQSVSYQRIGARLTSSKAFLVPAGIPFALRAARGQDLRVACFNINSQNNEEVLLTGGRNVWNSMSNPELEIAFNRPSREVKQLLHAQRDVAFVEERGSKGREEREEEGQREEREEARGREKREEGGRGLALESILDFAGF